jgi:CxxC motif-containing protein
MTFLSGVATRQTIPTVNRPTSASVTNGTAFKMMSISGNICPRCSKTVYSAEEVKAAGKVNDSNACFSI